MSPGPELTPVFNRDELDQALVQALQPEDHTEIGLGQSHLVSTSSSSEAGHIDVRAGQVLGDDIKAPLVEDVVVLVRVGTGYL